MAHDPRPPAPGSGDAALGSTVLTVETVAERCLAWLHAQPEAQLPVLLMSGGPPTPEARWHVLAARPRFVITGSLARDRGAEGGRFRVVTPQGGLLDEAPPEALLDLLRRWQHRFPLAPRAADVPFGGGFVGYFAYDLAWLFEYGLPRYLPASSLLPDLWLGFYDDPLVIDALDGRAHGSRAMLAELGAAPVAPRQHPPRVVERQGSFHREDYEAAVEVVRQHCLSGDIFQGDLTRRIALRIEGSASDLFAALVARSPAPCMAYLGLGDGRAVASASPEEFLRLRGRSVRTQPIKGTRPRGATPEADARLRAELLASDKDLAELTMIVDLMRNDLGRVATPGSVRVREFPVLQALPQVHHLCGVVEAELQAGRDFWDLLAGSFPPGSIVGAPKPRAIEILERVERSRRGVYTGAIGWMEPGGDAHLAVAIRTAEWCRGQCLFGVGGGITALSDPAAEYEETLDKARGLWAALGLDSP